MSSNPGWDRVLFLAKTERFAAVMYGVSPYKAYNNTKLETMRYPCQACALLFSPQVCPESRGSSWSRRLQDRVGLPSWRSRRDAGEPASRPLPFFFLPSRLSSPVAPFPSFAFLCHSLFLSYQCARLRFHLSFSSFPLKRRRRWCRPALRPFRIIRSPFFSSHTVSFYSFPSRAVSFCLSPLLPVAMILSTRLLLPLVITVDIFCLRRNLWASIFSRTLPLYFIPSQ